MAVIEEIDEAAWQQWLSERPEVVRKIAERLRPDRLYRHTKTGQRMTIESYSENGTVSVAVRAQYNLTDFEREVFGVNPDHLVECDLPERGELVGALLTEPDTLAAYIELIRPAILARRAADPDDPYGKKKQ